MELLTVKECAALKGCSERNLQQSIASGAFPYKETVNDRNRKMYLIPVDALEQPLQVKYYQQRYGSIPEALQRAKPDQHPERVKSLEEFTANQRLEIERWISILTDWRSCRDSAQYASKCEADRIFIAQCRSQYTDLNISKDALYRKWSAYQADDLSGLVDKRGTSRKGITDMDDQIWRIFLSYYLDQAEHPVTQCIRFTSTYLQERQPELLSGIPAKDSFYRRIESDVPAAVKAFNRKGEKALHDRFAPYILRMIGSMQSNDYWVADNHTFDFMTLGENGRPHRLYLTAYLDVRSTAFVGWRATTAPCGDATLLALKSGIITNGIPKNLYVDNGSEFLVHDIGGRGHRKRKSQKEESFEPPGVFKRLGINMINAIPGNPEAKIIERIFLDVKNMLSRLVDSYCGGKITERPERLEKLLKSREIPTDDELIEIVDEFVAGYYNYLPYSGSVKKDCGKTKWQVYLENRNEMRIPKSREDLNLMMMRSSRPKKVGRRGLHLEIAGFPMDYWTDEFLEKWQDKRVYYRYDPEDLTHIRVYNEEDQFITDLPVDNAAVMEYGAAVEQIKAGMQKINRYNKRIREWSKDHVLSKDEKISALMLTRIQARRNLENPPEYSEITPKVVHLVQADEQLYMDRPIAVGELTSLNSMIDNVRRFKEETEYGENL